MFFFSSIQTEKTHEEDNVNRGLDDDDEEGKKVGLELICLSIN